MISDTEKIILTKLRNELINRDEIDSSYSVLYKEFEDEELKELLSSYHSTTIRIFEYINKQRESRRIHAYNSREIIELNSNLKKLIKNIKSINFSIIGEYGSIFEKLETFINGKGGSQIPEDFLEINIIETAPLFIINDSITKVLAGKKTKLMPIGKGSYAEVYKFFDEDYQEYFTLKRLSKKATDRDYERIEREFETMKKLNSPFIAKVYKMNSEKKEYIMEYLDESLFDFIERENSKINIIFRYYIIGQIIRGFKYLEVKKILHRDISPKNIMLKHYEDKTINIKISDFGLVKLEDSTLTEPNSEFKGSLNDPNLRDIGFDKYNLIHEMYSLTRLVGYILTGKSVSYKIVDKNILKFFDKGTSVKKEERYQNIKELEEGIKELRKNMQS